MKTKKLSRLFKFIKPIKKKKFSSFVLLVVIIASYFLGALSSFAFNKLVLQKNVGKGAVVTEQGINLSKIQAKVLPQKGYKVKIKWSDLGKKMIEDGVIDEQKLAKA